MRVIANLTCSIAHLKYEVRWYRNWSHDDELTTGYKESYEQYQKLWWPLSRACGHGCWPVVDRLLWWLRHHKKLWGLALELLNKAKMVSLGLCFLPNIHRDLSKISLLFFLNITVCINILYFCSPLGAYLYGNVYIFAVYYIHLLLGAYVFVIYACLYLYTFILLALLHIASIN